MWSTPGVLHTQPILCSRSEAVKNNFHLFIYWTGQTQGTKKMVRITV